MAEITAAMVKELRDRSGAGMMEAKKALVTAGGDVEAAIKHLRETGAIKAEKKADRAANEGRVAGYAGNGVAALVEINCETDFVAKNEEFVALANKIAEAVAKAPAGTDVNNIRLGDGQTVLETLKQRIATTGENLKIGKIVRLEAPGTYFGLYIHNNAKLGTLAQIKGEPTEKGAVMAKDVAMHVAFTNPAGLDRSSVPADLVESEKAIFKKQVEAEGKPANVADKIVEGKLNSFYKERVLLEQMFIKDTKKSVQQVVKEAGPYELVKYAYVNVG